MAQAYVLLNCDLGAEEEIIGKLKELENVKEVHGTFGAYDIIAEVHGQTQEDFEKTVAKKIRKLTRVVSTMTLNVLNPE